MKAKRLAALLLVVAMLFTFVSVIAACDKHECQHVCPTCGKCTDKDCTDPVCVDKCQGHTPAPHVCGHVCPTCDKCTDSTCTDPVCADKCPGHDVDPSKEGDFTPITQPVAGKYYMGMKCSGDVYYYLKGGMNGFYMATSSNQEDAVVVTLVADGDGWLLKQGEQYMEIENSNGHINAVYKDAQTAGKHWSWDETYKIFTWEDGTYFYGTYGTYNTIGGGEYATHAADNYKAQLGLFVPVTVGEVESVSIMDGSYNYTDTTAHLLPLEDNSISFAAKVNPSNAPQDIVWSVTNGDIATVTTNDTTEETKAIAKVTYKGQEGSITLTATAKGTNISASVTVEIRDVKGSKEDNPLTVDEAIVLMDTTPGEYLHSDSKNHGYYIQGVVATGSKPTSTGWSFTLVGSDGKGINCSVPSSNLNDISVPSIDGSLDNCEVLFYAYTLYKSEDYSSTGNTNELKRCKFPDLETIVIEATQTEVTVPYSVEVTVKSITPANAAFENGEWVSSQQDKATVEGDKTKATVTAVAAGTTEITVKCGAVTSNAVTITVKELQASKAILDWTSKLDASAVVDNLYTGNPRGSNHKTEFLDKWSPEQGEITAITFTGSCKLPGRSATEAGFGYKNAYTAASASITTMHSIKKVTFKIIPCSDATTIQFSLNGQVVNETVSGSDGTLASAREITVELTEATTALELAFTPLQETGNNFIIIGITFEW